MVKISIIVPVYNVEKYLRKCIDSVIAQSFENLEVILVDDGSSDHCPIICDEYGSKDERVKVIHKRNEGLSEARNSGLKKASGKYILFLDSDDYINLDTCIKLLDLAEKNNADIVTGEFRNIFCNADKIMKNYKTDKVISGIEFLKMQFKNKIYRPNVVINLYRRKFLIDHFLFFKYGIYHEDEEWTPRVFLKAQRVISSGYCFYNRLIRKNSIMTQLSKDKSAEDSMHIAVSMIEKFSNIQDNELKRYLCDHMITLYFRAVIFRSEYYMKHEEELDRKFPLKHVCRNKNKFWAYLFVFNFKFFCYIWGVRQFVRNKFFFEV